MRKLVLAVSMICLALLGVAPLAFAQGGAQGLNGVWLGYYGYGDATDRVQFQLKAMRAGAAFTATTIEPNTFGTKDALFLTADVAGTVSADGGVRFTKTYDGTGGQTHSVQYAGALDATKRCISGTWKIDATTGPFRLCMNVGLVS
jgi:hypothetical protein